MTSHKYGMEVYRIPMPKILFWNVRGLNRLSKRYMIKQVVRDGGYNIICIQETKTESFSAIMAKQITGSRNFEFFQKSAVGLAGGMVLLWDTSH